MKWMEAVTAPKTGMLPRILTPACFLAQVCFATATSALELEYVSHLKLYFPEIGLTEPSGLAIAPDGSGYWVVSDETRTVFKLEADGEIGSFLGHDDHMVDLEGVVVDAGHDRLLMVSERTSHIIAVSLDPPHRFDVVKIAELPTPTDLSDALADHGNGLEGIGLDPETGFIFVLKERKPRLLVTIAPAMDRVIAVRNLDSVLPDGEDVSGLTFDPDRNGFWIVSDIGKSVHFLSNDGNAVITSDLFWKDKDGKHKLDNAEGVALSSDGQHLFVVSDDKKKSRLVQYKIIDDKTHSDQ